MAVWLDKQVDVEYRTNPITPAWKVLGKNRKKKPKDSTVDPIITWFEETREILEGLSETRIETHINNLLWYTGEYDKTLEYRIVVPGRQEQTIPRRMIPRIFNHLHDITEQRVAKLSRYKPSFDCVPTNREENDRRVARLIKVSLDAMARRVHVDFLMQEVERWCAVFGEVFIGVEWDKNIGDKKSRGSLERVGDVNVYVKPPWTVFPEPKRHWDDVKWLIDIESIMHYEEARVRFKDNSINPDGKRNIFTFNSDVEEKREDELVVYRIICKPSEFIPEGNMTYICGDRVVDEVTEYPYSHAEFPFERHTDIDVPGRLFPLSFYQHIKPIQHIYNKLTSIITRNILLTAHPHIVMPKGAAKLEAFANAPTAIEYNGPIAPTVLTFSSVPQEIFSFRTEVKAEIGQIGGIQGVSRGAPPPGSRAASMLRFYEEQEEQRASTQIIKHNELIRRTYLKAASIIGDYYPTTGKERMLRVVGKENEYMIRAFEGVKISSEYDIIIQNSTGFSESMSGRLEEVQLIQQFAPGLLSPEQMADVLELKNPQKAYDIATAALRHAEEENERFLDGEEVSPPKEYQDVIIHWKTHMIQMNSSTWENNVPEDIKRRMEDHILATEYLMEEKASINPAFAQLLASLPGYPVFWTPTPQQDTAAPQGGPAQEIPPGAADLGGMAPQEGLPPELAMAMQAGAGGNLSVPQPSPVPNAPQGPAIPSALGV